MDKKEKILKLYYEDDVEIKNIVDIVCVSRPYISRIIINDERYANKKQQKKEQTKKRKKAYTKEKMREIRELNIQQEAFIKQQHFQATRELSSGNFIINNRAFLKWNSSAYKYDENRNRYEFDKKLTRSYAVPKFIK